MDKNILVGVVVEVVMMIGFENNVDVVCLVVYVLLFNKVLMDGIYCWILDCIWFDDEMVWYILNYYVQQFFVKYVGD